MKAEISTKSIINTRSRGKEFNFQQNEDGLGKKARGLTKRKILPRFNSNIMTSNSMKYGPSNISEKMTYRWPPDGLGHDFRSGSYNKLGLSVQYPF